MTKRNGLSPARCVNYSAAVFMAVLTLCSCSADRGPLPLDLEEKERADAELQSVLGMAASRKIPRVEFETDSSTLLDSSDDLLDRVAAILKQHPRLQLMVEGHTDDVGSDEDNDVLSLKRAEAVKQRLTEEGVSPDSVTVVGYGKSRPLTYDTSEKGRAQNRRVEFLIRLRN